MENQANSYPEKKEIPENKVWDMSDVDNILYGTGVSSPEEENAPEDLPEAVEDYEAFMAAQGVVIRFTQWSLQQMMRIAGTKEELCDEMDYEEDTNRAICFGGDDTWHDDKHLWLNVEAAERAHTLEKNKLEELAENLNEDRSLKAMARAAKYIYNKLEISGTLKVVDQKQLPETEPRADNESRVIYGDQSSYLNLRMQLFTEISLNVEELGKEDYNGWGILSVIGHEVWHGHQMSQVHKLVQGNLRDNPAEAERATLYLFNHINYISGEVDYEIYQDQLMESEANAFGQEIASAWTQDWDNFDANSRYEILTMAEYDEEEDYDDESDREDDWGGR